MPVTVSILYPRNPTSTFNQDYYLDSHMPLAKNAWGKYGMLLWRVVKLNDNSPYFAHTYLEFTSSEDFDKALGDEKTADVMADIGNYTNETPIIIRGEIVLKSES